jgi:hypothetical protein
MKLIKTASLAILKYVNFVIPKYFSKYGFNVPVMAGVGIYNIRITEKWMGNILKNLNDRKPISCFIDIGVNIGQTYMKLKNVNEIVGN